MITLAILLTVKMSRLAAEILMFDDGVLSQPLAGGGTGGDVT